MSNLITPTNRLTLAPQNMPEALQFAEVLAKSTIVPTDYRGRPANVLVAMLQGMELGLGPIQALQGIAVINGRPSVWGDTLLAIVQGSGLLEGFSETQTDDAATCVVKRKGMGEATRVFTAADAKKAGLWGKQGPWSQYPKRMMQMRARSFALRDMFADVLRGIQSAEEQQDIPIEVTATLVPEPEYTQEPVTKPKALPPAQEPLERKPNGRAVYTAGGQGPAPVAVLASDDQRGDILLAAAVMWPKWSSEQRFAKVRAELKKNGIEWEYMQAETADKYLALLKSRAEKAAENTPKPTPAELAAISAQNADTVLAAGGQA